MKNKNPIYKMFETLIRLRYKMKACEYKCLQIDGEITLCFNLKDEDVKLLEKKYGRFYSFTNSKIITK